MKFFFLVLKKILKLLSPPQRLTAIKVLALTLVGAVIDILGLSLVLPVLAISSSPTEITSNPSLLKIINLLDFSSINQFLVFIYALLLLVFLLRALIFLYIKFIISNFSFGLASSFSKKMFHIFMYKPLDFYKKNSSSDLLRDLYVSTQQFASYLIIPIILTLSELFIVVIILIGLFLFNIQVFVLLIIVLAPITLLFYSQTKSKIESIGHELYALNGELINKVQQGISGFIDVKLSGREFFFIDRFYQDQKKYKKLSVTKSVLNDVFPKVIEFSAVLGIVVIFIYSLFFLDEEKREMLILLSLFGASAYRILPSINRIMAGMLLIRQYAYLTDVIGITKDYDDLLHNKDEEIAPMNFKQSLSIENVKFYYSKENIFGIDIPKLTISKGEKIGIIGKSGSGKTTLANLILGFYDIAQGEILVDNTRLTSEEWPAWKKNFGYVQQDVFVSDVSIKENIAFGVDLNEIDVKKVHECVKLALLDSFVDTLKDGIESKLGENGKNMSGGQKQRLAIARSLYFNRQFLVFDEATSALDNETEKEITDSIKSLSEGNMTMIIIAHRHSTLKYCDRIIELDKGKIIKELSYQELVKRI